MTKSGQYHTVIGDQLMDKLTKKIHLTFDQIQKTPLIPLSIKPLIQLKKQNCRRLWNLSLLQLTYNLATSSQGSS